MPLTLTHPCLLRCNEPLFRVFSQGARQAASKLAPAAQHSGNATQDPHTSNPGASDRGTYYTILLRSQLAVSKHIGTVKQASHTSNPIASFSYLYIRMCLAAEWSNQKLCFITCILCQMRTLHNCLLHMRSQNWPTRRHAWWRG